MKSKFILLATLALIALVALGVAWRMGWIHEAIAWKEPLLATCRAYPLALFLAIAILPGLAFPAAPLFILAGVVWGADALTCAMTLAAVMLNITWSHAFAAGWGQKIIQRLLGEHWVTWKSNKGSHDWRLAAVLRLTPGVPLFAQNYLLGLIGMPLRYSLGIALPTTGLYVCGFVLTGGAIFEGQTGRVILGISLLIATSLAVKIVRQRLLKRGEMPLSRPA
jgi:uncharacterized membrane protein YdjX (TVP38/TMEM64 family)